MIVRIVNQVSEKREQQNEVPQGSVLSVSLLAFKVNDIINKIPKYPNLHYSLYVDDLQNKIPSYGYKCDTTRIAAGHRQSLFMLSCVNKAMHFNILLGLHLNPILKLDNHNVEYCREIKCLGLTWD